MAPAPPRGLHGISTSCRRRRDPPRRYRLRIEPTRPAGFDFGLVPLLQWYDSTHVCSTRHYRDFVYRGDLVKRGGFVEDKLGQYQLADIRANGMDAHAKYAQFVLDDGVDAPMVSHLDGHDALSFRKFSFVRRDFDEEVVDS